jgi:hypothetical protein
MDSSSCAPTRHRGAELLGGASAILGHDQRQIRLPDELVEVIARERFARRVRADESTLRVERVDRVGVMIEQRSIPLLALAQPIRRSAALGDVLEEDREPAAYGKIRFSNHRRTADSRPRSVAASLGDRALVRAVKRLANAFGKLAPDVLADERRGLATEHRPACSFT